MINYKEADDTELNRLVTLSRLEDDGYTDVSEREVGFLVTVDGKYRFPHPVTDYCNSPDETWTITEEFNIDFRYGYEEEGVPCALIGDEEDYTFWYSDKSRLRAALIVYLLSKENKPNE